MYSIGIEIMQGVAASMGVVLTVPIVSFMASRQNQSIMVRKED